MRKCNVLYKQLGFMFDMIYYYPIMCFIPNLIFFTISLGAKTCNGSLVLFGCGIKIRSDTQHQIGAKVLVGACLSFWSHQFISNVLEYIHVFQLTNGFCHSKQVRKPIKYEMKYKQANDNISSHPMPHQYCPAHNYPQITFCLDTMALEDESEDDLVCFHMAFFMIRLIF